MKLATKGLLVVSFPLIFQLIIVIVLALLLWHVQQLAAKEARAQDVISECNRLSANMGTLMQSVFASDRASGILPRPLTQSDLDYVRSSVRALQQRLVDEPLEAKNVQRLSRFAEKFVQQLQVAKAEDPHNILGPKDLLELKLFVTTQHLFDIFNNMIEIENQTQPKQPELREKARQLIRLWLLAAVVVSSLAALALAYFSSMTISKPLQRMVKNALSISKRQPLEPEMIGNDELANLDRLLHTVNDAIEQALINERNLINYAADLVFSIDKNGVFKSVNPYSATLLGVDHEKLIGTSVLLLISKENRDQVNQYFSNYYQYKEGQTLSFEVRMQSKDLEAIDTSWSAIWSQREKSFFCVAHDITERKHVERLKQDFIAMISHDLRTPLMSVLSSINLVQSGAAGQISAPVESELNGAERSVDHLIELVNDLLDFEKLEAGRMDFDMVPTQISEIVNESVRMVQALSDQRHITIESPVNDFTVVGDQRKLIQVLVNLLSNALKHSPEGGVIKVQTRLVNGMVELAIHDQGPGVPYEFAEKIFAPFEQISHRSSAALGTGLGLAICKLIVEGHGGTIAVRHSDVLVGSAFWFTLPPVPGNRTGVV
jgi:PAS domain S-box-containing protein